MNDIEENKGIDTSPIVSKQEDLSTTNVVLTSTNLSATNDDLALIEPHPIDDFDSNVATESTNSHSKDEFTTIEASVTSESVLIDESISKGTLTSADLLLIDASILKDTSPTTKPVSTDLPASVPTESHPTYEYITKEDPALTKLVLIDSKEASTSLPTNISITKEASASSVSLSIDEFTSKVALTYTESVLIDESTKKKDSAPTESIPTVESASKIATVSTVVLSTDESTSQSASTFKDTVPTNIFMTKEASASTVSLPIDEFTLKETLTDKYLDARTRKTSKKQRKTHRKAVSEIEELIRQDPTRRCFSDDEMIRYKSHRRKGHIPLDAYHLVQQQVFRLAQPPSQTANPSTSKSSVTTQKIPVVIGNCTKQETKGPPNCNAVIPVILPARSDTWTKIQSNKQLRKARRERVIIEEIETLIRKDKRKKMLFDVELKRYNHHRSQGRSKLNAYDLAQQPWISLNTAKPSLAAKNIPATNVNITHPNLKQPASSNIVVTETETKNANRRQVNDLSTSLASNVQPEGESRSEKALSVVHSMNYNLIRSEIEELLRKDTTRKCLSDEAIKRYAYHRSQGCTMRGSFYLAQQPEKPRKDIRRPSIERKRPLSPDVTTSSSSQQIQSTSKKAKIIEDHGQEPSTEVSSSRRSPTNPSDENGTINLAIIHNDHPHTCLSQEVANVVQKTILNLFSEAVKLRIFPQFTGLRITEGCIIVSCVNSETSWWLLRQGHVITALIGVPINVIKEEDIPQMDIITGCFYDSSEDDDVTILDFIQNQNKDIFTKRWKVINRLVSGSTIMMVFSIDRKSMETLVKCDFCISFKFGSITFNVKPKDITSISELLQEHKYR